MEVLSRLKILFLTSEAVPFAKTGGLADVAGSLPKALAAQGHDIRLCLPRYKGINQVNYFTDLPVLMDGHYETAIIRQTTLKAGEHDTAQVPVYLVDNYLYFYREGLYMHHDDAARFNFFCKAVLSMLPRIDFKPDVIHCNDWQTGLIPLLLQAIHHDDPFYSDIATVFTVHNLQYQGRFPKQAFHLLALDEHYYSPESLEFYNQVNYLKGGLVYADVLNTVSHKYAQEIQTAEMGEGLDGMLRKRGADLYGILNGLDYTEFDPERDPHIAAHFSPERLEGKSANKQDLQREMELPQRQETPLLGIISRLVDQKGLDLLAGIMDRLMKEDVQFVLLGTGDDRYQQLFSNLRLQYRDKIGVRIGFDAGLAQRIYAGCDMFLMPSRFEPCGLGQLISLRYGTIPVVRSTGGLEDTIVDYMHSPATGNGFSFKDYSSNALLDTINRALEVYRHQPQAWRELVQRAMKMDFSWNRSAQEYTQLYQRAINKLPSRQYRAG